MNTGPTTVQPAPSGDRALSSVGTTLPLPAAAAPERLRPEQWKIDVNSREQKFVDVVIGLATGALVLPALLLRTYLGVTDQPLALFLDWPVYASWLSLFLAICLGVAFHYFSAKWVKHAWGVQIRIRPRILERIMDALFWATVFFFLMGLSLFGVYIRRA
jgi:hypothetical protein